MAAIKPWHVILLLLLVFLVWFLIRLIVPGRTMGGRSRSPRAGGDAFGGAAVDARPRADEQPRRRLTVLAEVAGIVGAVTGIVALIIGR